MAEKEEKNEIKEDIKFKIAKKFDELGAKLLRKYKPTQRDKFALFDLLKCRSDFLINILKKKKLFHQLFILFFEDLFLDEKYFKEKKEISNKCFDYIDEVISFFGKSCVRLSSSNETKSSLFKQFSDDILSFVKNLGFPLIIGDIIINRMNVKSTEIDMRNVFLRYFIPLFQIKFNVAKFVGFDSATLKEIIDCFYLVIKTGKNKRNIPPSRLDLVYDNKSRKKIVIINPLNNDELEEYINDNIVIFEKGNPNPETEIPETKEKISQPKKEISQSEKEIPKNKINYFEDKGPNPINEQPNSISVDDNAIKKQFEELIRQIDELKKNEKIHGSQIDELKKNEKIHWLEIDKLSIDNNDLQCEIIRLNKKFDIIKLRYAFKCLINCLYYGMSKQKNDSFDEKLSSLLYNLQRIKDNNAITLSIVLSKIKDNIEQGNVNAHEIDTSRSILEQIFTAIDPQNNYMSLKNSLINDTNIDSILKELVTLKQASYKSKTLRAKQNEIYLKLNKNQISQLFFT